jgi:hypothetical protein
MTPAEAHRPVLIVLAAVGALALSACGVVEGDRHRFQTMADHVASIDIPMDPKADRPGDLPQRRMNAEEQGLRPAKFSPMQVALMTPHEMWDARDAQSRGESGLRDAVVRMAEPAVEAAAPVVARAVVQQAAARVEQEPQLRPAVVRAEARPSGRTIQLGAYSSEAGAREAWSRFKASAGLSNLSPVFEGVQVNGRSLTRLKVGPIPAEAAAALCQAAQVADPWCRRQG